ncbi:MAG: putative sporulation protein YtxC [Clostridia bacterium]|nr:putative sporulation protein YtxC [Clostridia bacterium]
MPSFRVDHVKDIKGLAGYLEKRFESHARSPFRIRISQEEECLTVLMDGCIRKNGRKYLSVLNNLSDMLAEYILKSYEKNILEKIITRFCVGLPKSDRDEIYRIACSRLYTQAEGNLGNLIETRRKLISSKIAEYLRDTENLTLEGFVTFRLGEYVSRLETEIERSIRQYYIERQYEEYISLLSAFVRMQVPRVPELHVFVLKDGRYKVEGTGPFDIPEDVTEGFGIKKGDPVIDDDDFMIGFLLTCAPVRIFIHNATSFKNKELLNTIRIVFQECVLLNE